jgi:UMP-CMP kinase
MRLTFCPFSLGVFVGSAYLMTLKLRREEQEKALLSALPSCQVVFVLGGPGAGKGTQCQLLSERLPGWAHLSAGDLLRAERKKGGELGDLINEKIANGQLVPSEVTCKLIENAMEDAYKEYGIDKFLIDGFPRSIGNADAWKTTMSRHQVKLVLCFECPEEVLVGRLLERGKTSGRNDDTVEVIRKRFQTYRDEEGPIVALYEKEGKVRKIASDRSVEDIYKDTSLLIQNC